VVRAGRRGFCTRAAIPARHAARAAHQDVLTRGAACMLPKTHIAATRAGAQPWHAELIWAPSRLPAARLRMHSRERGVPRRCAAPALVSFGRRPAPRVPHRRTNLYSRLPVDVRAAFLRAHRVGVAQRAAFGAHLVKIARLARRAGPATAARGDGGSPGTAGHLRGRGRRLDPRRPCPRPPSLAAPRRSWKRFSAVRFPCRRGRRQRRTTR
jgi:hypothetical protein